MELLILLASLIVVFLPADGEFVHSNVVIAYGLQCSSLATSGDRLREIWRG